jgi:hypothetical protein
VDRRGPSRPRRRDGRAAPLPGPATQARLSPLDGRFALAAVAAAAAGIGLAWIDTRPGFDDTGVLVGLLLAGAVLAVLVDGSGSMIRAAIVAGLIGVPTPTLELAGGGQAASLIALVVTLAAALGTAAAVRGLRASAPTGRS